MPTATGISVRPKPNYEADFATSVPTARLTILSLEIMPNLHGVMEASDVKSSPCLISKDPVKDVRLFLKNYGRNLCKPVLGHSKSDQLIQLQQDLDQMKRNQQLLIDTLQKELSPSEYDNLLKRLRGSGAII